MKEKVLRFASFSFASGPPTIAVQPLFAYQSVMKDIYDKAEEFYVISTGEQLGEDTLEGDGLDFESTIVPKSYWLSASEEETSGWRVVSSFLAPTSASANLFERLTIGSYAQGTAAPICLFKSYERAGGAPRFGMIPGRTSCPGAIGNMVVVDLNTLPSKAFAAVSDKYDMCVSRRYVRVASADDRSDGPASGVLVRTRVEFSSECGSHFPQGGAPIADGQWNVGFYALRFPMPHLSSISISPNSPCPFQNALQFRNRCYFVPLITLTRAGDKSFFVTNQTCKEVFKKFGYLPAEASLALVDTQLELNIASVRGFSLCG